MSELVIDDTNFMDFTGDGKVAHFGGEDRLLTCLPRRTKFGQCAYASPGLKLIPRDMWPKLIQEKDAQGSWLHDLIKDVIPCCNQDGLGYCHAYGSTHPMMAMRVTMGLPFVHLSAESIGGEVTGWRNEGGMLDDDLRVACELGACEQSYMDKEHSIKPDRWKAGWKENRKNYRVIEWWDLDGGNTFDALGTCALLNIPCNTGFGWWGHAITGGLRLRQSKGRWEAMFRNSWGPDYGEDGFFWMAEGKGTPDLGCFGVRQMTAYAG